MFGRGQGNIKGFMRRTLSSLGVPTIGHDQVIHPD